GQVHFARNHLHRFLRKAVAVGDDRQGITFKASGSENVKCVEAAVHGSSDCSPRSCKMAPGLREGPFVNESTCVRYSSCTTLVTASRTRRVISGLPVSEYTRRSVSVPEARTITQPASPRYTLIPSIFSRRTAGRPSRLVTLPFEKCSIAF